MKRVFLLIVVPALLVALGFAQTPGASINTDQTKIIGCLRGSDGNYTLLEDNTGHIFKITTSSVDLKPHLGHDVTLIGHRASGVSSAAADSSFAVTELNMISEHCAQPAAAAAAAPTAMVGTPSETTSPPSAAATAPAATISTPAETATTPAVAATPPAETATPPAEIATTPALAATPRAETASRPAAAAAQTTRPPARPRRLSATPAAAVTTPAVTASTSSETVSTSAPTVYTPAETASTSSETASTPAAAATKPTATAKGGSLWLLISFVVLVIVIGTLVPFLSKWRKRKTLERTGDQNLSFTHEVSSDHEKSDRPDKAA